MSGDDTLTITFVVTNDTAAPLTLAFPDARQYDITVAAAGDATPWRWSDDRMFAQGATTRRLAPGERWTIVEHAPAPARGPLVVHAFVECASHVASASAVHEGRKP